MTENSPKQNAEEKVSDEKPVETLPDEADIAIQADAAGSDEAKTADLASVSNSKIKPDTESVDLTQSDENSADLPKGEVNANLDRSNLQADLAQHRGDSVDSTDSTDLSLVCGECAKSKVDQSSPSLFMKHGYQILLVLLLILAFLLSMVYQTLFGRLDQGEQRISVAQGETYYGLLPKFQGAVPLFSANVAKLYIRSRVRTPLQAGMYELPANPNLLEVIEVLQKGEQVALMKVQVIEGRRARDLYKTLREKSNLSLAVLGGNQDPKSNEEIAIALNLQDILPDSVKNSDDPIVRYNLEGWFAPDTYFYAETASDEQILRDLYQKQRANLEEAWQNRDADLPYKTPYEALIMASIIEKETGLPKERPLVAGVFVNRLKKGMRLQTDPTVIYGLGDRYDGDIKSADLKEKTVYNTYQIDGLPPTPIALPSKAAILAAVHPEKTEALYFVATGFGGHKFSKTLAEHNQAVKEYLAVMKARRANPEQNSAQTLDLVQNADQNLSQESQAKEGQAVAGEKTQVVQADQKEAQ